MKKRVYHSVRLGLLEHGGCDEDGATDSNRCAIGQPLHILFAIDASVN